VPEEGISLLYDLHRAIASSLSIAFSSAGFAGFGAPSFQVQPDHGTLAQTLAGKGILRSDVALPLDEDFISLRSRRGRSSRFE